MVFELQIPPLCSAGERPNPVHAGTPILAHALDQMVSALGASLPRDWLIRPCSDAFNVCDRFL